RYVSSSTPVTEPVLALPSVTTENVGKVFVDEEDQEEEVCIDTEVREDTQLATYTESFPQISLPALSGVSTFQTMRVRGYVGKQPLHILIGCGSTHNFLDTYAAKILPCQSSVTTPLRVYVANGSKMVSSSEYNTFKWTLQGNEYEADYMLLPLGGCDMRKLKPFFFTYCDGKEERWQMDNVCGL
nr:retrotransposable element Tf2 [Tanacetum cinerariifolium]